jgi:hypothetical protein
MEELLTLLQRRQIELECYRDVTRRLVYEPIDDFPDLFILRDEIIEELTETAKLIKAAKAGIPDFSSDPRISDVESKIAEMKRVISKDDAAAAKRIKSEMDETLELIKSSSKTGRVASYIRKTNFNVSRGSTLNTVS